MLLKHLDAKQLAALEAGRADRETKDHFATCSECRSRMAEARQLMATVLGSSPTARTRRAEGHPEAEVLAAYVDGSLVGTRAMSVQQHLEACDVCRGDVLAMHRLSVTQPSGEKSPDRAVRRLMQRLSEKGAREAPKSLGRWLVALGGKAGAAFAPLTTDVQDDMLSRLSASTLSASPTEAMDAASRYSHDQLQEADAAGRRLLESAEHWNAALHAYEHRTRRENPAAAEVSADLVRESDEVLRHVNHVWSFFQSRQRVLREQPPETERLMAQSRRDLELNAGDLHLRFEGPDPKRPHAITVTVTDQSGRPVGGVELEVSSPATGTLVRTTDQAGRTAFSFEHGPSRLRVRHDGVWDLELTRLR
jgi:anti-sigma factor RsiW